MNARPTLWLLALMAVPVAAAETESPSAEEPTVLDPVIVEGEQTPLPTLRLSPPYPPAARHRWTEGCVLLQFTVREDGKTLMAQPTLDGPPLWTLDDIRRCQYEVKNPPAPPVVSLEAA